MSLQVAVDELAMRIGRPVLLEDHAQRVLAYSEQTDPMDDIRRNSILRRHTTPEVRQRFRSAGIFESRGPLRIPGASGVLPRVCVPARHRDRLLGFLWLIDEPVMPDAAVAEASTAAGLFALSLLHDALAAGLSAQRELEAVSGVLLGDDTTGAQVLIDEGGFPPLPVTVLVARPTGPFDHDVMSQGLLAARTKLVARHLVRHDHGVLLCAGRVSAAEVHAAFAGSVVLGIGTARPLSHAARSYTEALHASVVAAQVPGYAPTATWAALGAYRMLAAVPADSLHPGLARLLSAPEHRPLVETLETYLDLAGSVVATSKALRLHRTSLYYRLQRVEALAETDLKDGNERLMLHLSLKLARLSGRFPT